MDNKYGKLKNLFLILILTVAVGSCAVKRKVPPPNDKEEIRYKETVMSSEYEDISEDNKMEPIGNENISSSDETLKPENEEIIDEENLDWVDAGYDPDETEELNNFTLKNIYFEYDRADLNEEARKMLGIISRWMEKNQELMLRIEGHADDRGTSEYNLALGERRANAVKKYILLLTIDESRLSTISYGEEMPVGAGQNEAAWAKNRRVHFVSK